MISNIQITDGFNNPFVANVLANTVQVAFTLDFGAANVSAIRYTLWEHNNLDMLEYLTTNAASRSYVFSTNSLSYSNTFSDIITAQVEIQLVSGNVSSAIYEKLIPDVNLDPETGIGFSRISVFQRQDGSGLVDINYAYQGGAAIDATNVSATYSVDNGNSWSNATSFDFRGDMGSGVLSGTNRIVWNPQMTFGNTGSLPTSAVFQLNLLDADGKTNSGVTSAVAVINLRAPEVAVRKLSLEEQAFL